MSALRCESLCLRLLPNGPSGNGRHAPSWHNPLGCWTCHSVDTATRYTLLKVQPLASFVQTKCLTQEAIWLKCWSWVGQLRSQIHKSGEEPMTPSFQMEIQMVQKETTWAGSSEASPCPNLSLGLPELQTLITDYFLLPPHEETWTNMSLSARAPITKHHRPAGWNHRHSFLILLEAKV